MDANELAERLIATGHAHHEAFIATHGFDREWPLWYAEHLMPELVGAGYQGTQAELVASLVEADRLHRAEAPDTPWPQFFAERIVAP